ncbi:hypothetical protein PRIPAC_76537 [Pristionchus pacificus]|uniref:Uncharacterized protein n=1 Tax=Pristionchus pacificus TaxID=54126 RepID=A0A2A6CSP1_PRIPA|nr:hypothetical protein PRIPAC_76537 [Pristionchus pacificus]|eukprot:PDM81063.1 hypothetical protein PRIPAC_36066 [Pristionchus pacificus]
MAPMLNLSKIRNSRRPTKSAVNFVPVPLFMTEQLKKDLELKTKENNRLKTKNDVLRKELEWSKMEIKRVECPLLSLPNELIGHIWSFLSIKDRMRARLCKRLDNLEMEYEYYVPRLIIHERMTEDPVLYNKYITDHKQYFVLLKEKVYPINFFKRIVQNARIGYFALNIYGREAFHWELCNLIKECDIDELKCHFKCYISDAKNISDVIVDSYLYGLMNACSKLELDDPAGITAEGLHKVYTCIMERSCKLHSINFGYTSIVLLKDFLSLVGIRFEGGKLFSARDIEAYQFTEIIECDEEFADEEDDVIIIHKHVFDRNFEMKFGQDEEDRPTQGWLSLKWHKTEEDLEKAKSTEGFVRLDLTDQ